METNVQFYFEPYINRSAGYKSKNTLLADWFCHSKEEIISQVIGMVTGARLKYKRFRVAAYNAETSELIHSTVNYN